MEQFSLSKIANNIDKPINQPTETGLNGSQSVKKETSGKMSEDKVRLKLMDGSCGFKIYQVDGRYVRDNLDIDFTDFASHKEKKYIPEGEIWLDKDYKSERQEYDQFVAHELVLNKGGSDEDALKAEHRALDGGGNPKLRFLGYYDGDISSDMESKDMKVDLVQDSFFGKTPDKESLKVFLVNGKSVRDHKNPNFTEGGHDLVYDFIPKGEVWIDDSLRKEEIPFVLKHELYERSRMSEGVAYAKAHQQANQIELHSRHLSNNQAKQIRPDFGITKKRESIFK